MKCQFYFLSYVNDILVVCRCIQGNVLALFFMRKYSLKIFVAKGDTGQNFFE